jgi:hypothetical protein
LRAGTKGGFLAPIVVNRCHREKIQCAWRSTVD